MQQKRPTVSVVIPAFNEATYIDRLLEALNKQSFKDFEVIVSDAESKDGTEQVVKSFVDKLDIKFIESPPKGPGAGRNFGAKQARGEWLLFLDADNEIDDHNFIGTLLSETQRNGWHASSARLKIKDNLFHKFFMWLDYIYIRSLARTKHPVAPGWCILTKRSIFEENDGFNEKIQFGEDYDYISRTAPGNFGFVETTYYYPDMRRAKTDRWVGLKAILNEIYRHTHGYKLDSNPFKYEFGKHKKREED